MARNTRANRRGGNRENAPAKQMANAALGAEVQPPIMRFQGQEYGEQAAQLDTQRRTRQAAEAIRATRLPVRPVADLDAPSERPGEPVTAGLPVGPGPGPEALGMGGVEPERDRLASYLPTLELLASQPGSSAALRQMVRMIRGAV